MKDVFDLNQIKAYNAKLFELSEIYLKSEIGDNFQTIKSYYEEILLDIILVADRFQTQLDKAIEYFLPNLETTPLYERAVKASKYFYDKMQSIFSLVYFLSKLEIEEYIGQEDIEEVLQEFMIEVELKQRLFNYLIEQDFEIKNFLSYKCKLLAIGDKLELKSYKNFIETIKEIQEEKPKNKDLELDDLYQRLKTWRKAKAEEEKLPAFCILTNTTLEEIVKHHPQTKEDLLKLKGFGEKKFEKYGKAILEIVLED